MKLLSKTLAVALFSAYLTACSTLPTSGPSYREIVRNSGSEAAVNDSAKVNLVELNEQALNTFSQQFAQQQFTGFDNLAAPSRFSGTANVGDVLEISIWEAPPAVLFGTTFSSEGQGSGHFTKLPDQTVNTQGNVTVPFIGDINVVGKTPEAIQAMIVNSLNRKANQPQAVVRIVNNNSADVTVIRQGNTIRMPLTPSRERVLDAVAAVGGSGADIQDVTIQLTRGHQVKTLPFETLISDPRQNIPLQANDVVTMLTSPQSFTGLGALGSNRQMKFSSKGLTLAEAIGQMGGLIDHRSDPRGVFVFRYVPFNQLNSYQQQRWESLGYGVGYDIPTVYRLDLLQPNAMFLMQRFPIQDKDILYVSNAPLAEFQKFLRMIFSLTSPVTSTIGSVNNL